MFTSLFFLGAVTKYIPSLLLKYPFIQNPNPQEFAQEVANSTQQIICLVVSNQPSKDDDRNVDRFIAATVEFDGEATFFVVNELSASQFFQDVFLETPSLLFIKDQGIVAYAHLPEDDEVLFRILSIWIK